MSFKRLATHGISGSATLLSSLKFPLKKMFKDTFSVFTYHEVLEKPSGFAKLNQLWICPENFEKQITYIQQNFDVVSPTDLPYLKSKGKYALITFDDGFTSYFDCAAPILEKLSCPSLIFLNAGPILNNEYFYSGVVNYCQHFIPEFSQFIKSKKPNMAIPSGGDFLFCDHVLLQEFLDKYGHEKIIEDAKAFYGKFSTSEHLTKVKNNKYVYFGNHLLNHYNAEILESNFLKEQYLNNESLLSQYPNYIPIFSYPFGVPSLCLSERTDRDIINCGAHYLFSAYSRTNQLPITKKMNRFSLPSDKITSRQIESYLMKMYLYDKAKIATRNSYIGYSRE